MRIRIIVGALALAILWVGSVFAQVSNGNFSSGAAGWTTVAPGTNDVISYGSSQLTATSNDNSSGNIFTYTTQTFVAPDPGFLSYQLTSYNSTDYGDYDYPQTSIAGTLLRITTSGALANSGALVSNNNQITSAITGAYGLTAGTHAIQFGVRSTDSVYGAGIAIWDDIEFQELTKSPGAQSIFGTTPLSFAGGTALSVATNTNVTSISVSLSVSNGTLTLASTTGLAFSSGSNGSASMAFSGTSTAINNALDGMVYSANSGFSGTDTLNISSTAGSISDPDTVAITVIGATSSMVVTKTASPDTNVAAGEVVTYTYIVENTGNQPLSNVSLLDVHNGSGSPPVPGSEALYTDAGTLGDSTDTSTNGVWDVLAPADRVVFTATYTVTQNDIDTKQ